jgi:uncharacterized glyoxalase superfamily protein PhnB
VPALRYRNVAAAIDWLCAAFAFDKHHVVTGEDGSILYAHLTLGNDMIMLLPVRDSGLDLFMKQPDEIGGAETQSCYLVVKDADAHYRNAKAAGADIVLAINDDDHGGRGYSCRDPEGHIWSFGTYDPWQRNPGTLGGRFPLAATRGKTLNRLVIMAAMLACITAAATAGWMLGRQPSANGDATGRNHDAIAAHERAEKAAAHANLLAAELARERSAKDAAERAAYQAREQLVQEQGAKETAERNARQIEKRLAEERRAKDVAERTAKDASEQLAKERTAKEAAERITSDTTKELTRERDAKQRAERSAQDTLEHLARERHAKEAAERAAKEARQQLAESQGAKKSVDRPAKGPLPGQAQEQNAKRAPAKSAMPPLIP